MASLKEIKTRIASVKNTLKITSAMKLVASAKLHRAQTAIEGMLPYSRRLEGMLGELMSVAGDSSPLTRGSSSHGASRVALVCVSSSTSLCGGFNNNLIRLAQQVIEDGRGQGSSVTLFPIGRKVGQALATCPDVHLIDDHLLIGEKPRYAEAATLSARLTDLYVSGEIDRVELLYTHYKNMAVQIPMRETFLPFATSPSEEETEGAAAAVEGAYILEPSASQLLADLMPQALAIRLYAMLLDSSAAEHAARTFAMQQATDNGEALLQELNLAYNKGRQQAITNELLDIVGGTLK